MNYPGMVGHHPGIFDEQGGCLGGKREVGKEVDREEGGRREGGREGGRGAVDREGGREGSKRLMERLFGYTVDRRGRAGARARGRAIVEGEQLEGPTISSG
jgi:hypothetical protein